MKQKTRDSICRVIAHTTGAGFNAVMDNAHAVYAAIEIARKVMDDSYSDNSVEALREWAVIHYGTGTADILKEPE